MTYKTVTAQDFMTTVILREALDEQRTLYELMKRLLNREVYLTDADLSKGVYTIPYPELINIIENNLRAFMAGGYVTDEMGAPIIWQGELNDRPRFSYSDVNRWFESCYLLTMVAYSVANRSLITGCFSSGNDKERQLIRTC